MPPFPNPFNLTLPPGFPFPFPAPTAAAPSSDAVAKARDVSTALEELREHLGWAWDGFSGIMSYKSTIYDSRWCIARSLRDVINYAPESVPAWFIDWFYVLYVSQRAVWQMISIALLAPSAGLKHTYGLMRACMSYLTLFWQAHVANTGMRLGGGGTPVWEWLSPEDMKRGIPG